MQTQLPETMNFMRQVERNYCYQGNILLSRLQRLSELLLDSDEGSVRVDLEFGTNVGYAGLKGSVTTELQLACQRCLQPVVLNIESHFKFAFIHHEEEGELLPEMFEPYLLESEEQSLIALLEDELLLSLPMVAMHENTCSAYMSDQIEQIKLQKQASHPFAALKPLQRPALKKKR